MNSPICIDIIIASYRVSNSYLLPIFQLEVPEDVTANFFLVIDNPDLAPDKALMDAIQNANCSFTVNPTNKGVSASRNIGLQGGTGNWVLFLDDDVEVSHNLLFEYAQAIKQNPNEIGFIGLVNLPVATTPYQQAVMANGNMTMFSIAQTEYNYAWGVTANLMLSRKAIGGLKFSETYPKLGGAEDAEFCLRVRGANQFNNYKTVKNATVTHPWWNGGQPELSRFYRYGLGISLLPQRNAIYRYYSFLNAIETVFVSSLFLLTTLFMYPVHNCISFFIAFIILTLVLEYIVCFRIALKWGKLKVAAIALNIMLIRGSNDAGVFIGNFRRLRISGLGERFQFNGNINNQSFALNTNRIIKILGYLAGVLLLIWYLEGV